MYAPCFLIGPLRRPGDTSRDDGDEWGVRRETKGPRRRSPRSGAEGACELYFVFGQIAVMIKKSWKLSLLLFCSLYICSCWKLQWNVNYVRKQALGICTLISLKSTFNAESNVAISLQPFHYSHRDARCCSEIQNIRMKTNTVAWRLFKVIDLHSAR
jgi:hypothetical protein